MNLVYKNSSLFPTRVQGKRNAMSIAFCYMSSSLLPSKTWSLIRPKLPKLRRKLTLWYSASKCTIKGEPQQGFSVLCWSECNDLKGPCLNTRFLVGGTVWESYGTCRKCSLAGGSMPLGVSFEILQPGSTSCSRSASCVWMKCDQLACCSDHHAFPDCCQPSLPWWTPSLWNHKHQETLSP